MAKRRENGEIGIFSLCLPVDISSVTGRCQRCWSHAKANDAKSGQNVHFPSISSCAFAPLREVKSSNRRTLESGQSGMLSDWLPVSLAPFHHPRAKLLLSHIPAANTSAIPAAPQKYRQSLTARTSAWWLGRSLARPSRHPSFHRISENPYRHWVAAQWHTGRQCDSIELDNAPLRCETQPKFSTRPIMPEQWLQGRSMVMAMTMGAVSSGPLTSSRDSMAA
jgi:hypothetical protein